MPHRLTGLLVAGLLFASVATPAAAVTANAQLEGLNQVIAPRAVTTTGPVTREDRTCADGTAISVLQTLTNGNWKGNKAPEASFDDPMLPGEILGEKHVFGSGGYWAIYINGAFQNATPCDMPVKAGDEVLFFASDDPFVEGVGGWDEPLYMTGAPTIAAPGQAITVTVQQTATSFNPDPPYEGTTSFAPAAGALVNGVTAGSDGKATISLTERGPQPVVATKGNRAPDRATVCVTDGQDGFCGTELAKLAEPCKTTGDDGRCGSPDKRASFGFIRSIQEQQRFSGPGPRELKGTVDPDPSGLRVVRLKLTRTSGGRCETFDGRSQQLVKAKACGAARGKWFSAGSSPEWTYLLPEALPKGRYVLDVKAVDGKGNKDTSLTRGRNRVVFHVA
jgi:hypothetical protein